MIEASITPDYPSEHSRQKYQWYNNLALIVLLNAGVWFLVLLYIKFFPHTYTSKWGIKFLNDPEVEVQLPDVGSASASPRFGGSITTDPRSDYVYIATSRAALLEAAKRLEMDLEEFGEPEITIDEDSGIIAFEIEGETPAQAQQKALIFHDVMNERLEKLRDNELQRQEKENQTTLTAARERLDAAQQKFSLYKAKSRLSTDEQIQEVVLNLEQLRRQQAELLAQERGFNSRWQTLAVDIELESPETTGAYKLQGDQVYQELLSEHAQAQATLVDLQARFTPQHPDVLSQKAKLEGALNALRQRATMVVGKPVNQQSLLQLTSLTLDPQVQTMREELYQDVLVNRAAQQQAAAQQQTLGQQVAQQEKRLSVLVQEQLSADKLRRDVQVAEAIFTNTLAKLDLGKANISTVYPPVQLVVEPSLPERDKPDSPSKRSAILAGLAGSLLVTTGVLLMRYDKFAKYYNQKE